MPNVTPYRSPLIAFDFARAKFLSGRMTHVRAQSATFIDQYALLHIAQSGEARLDFDPDTGDGKGFLLEGSRTNLILHSDQPSDAAFTKTRITATAALLTFPADMRDARLNAVTELFATAVAGTHLISQNVTVTAGHAVCFSSYIIPGAGAASSVRIDLGDSTLVNRVQVVVNLLTGELTSGPIAVGAATNVGASVEYYRAINAWRVSVWGIMDGVSTTMQARYVLLDSTGATSWTGDGVTRNLSTFGWQVEAQAGAIRPSSYIITAGATVTRPQDVCTVLNAGWPRYNTFEGTLLISGIIKPQLTTAYTPTFLSISDGTGNNRMRIYQGTNGALRMQQTVAGVANVGIDDFTPTEDTPFVCAVRLKASDYAIVSNVSRAVTKSLTGAMIGAAPTQINIGSDVSGAANALNSWVKLVRYYPVGFTDYELKKLVQVD